MLALAVLRGTLRAGPMVLQYEEAQRIGWVNPITTNGEKILFVFGVSYRSHLIQEPKVIVGGPAKGMGLSPGQKGRDPQ